MVGIRDHSVFTIKAIFTTKSRIENSSGELVSYGPEHETERTLCLVAPSQLIARAWVRDQVHFVRILSIHTAKLDAFIQDHIY